MHLHNLRLFCAIGVARARRRPLLPLPPPQHAAGLVLNCRGSLPEAAVYAAALARHQPAVFESVDRFVVPSSYAAGQSALLGVPADRIDVVPHYLPAEAFAERSRADQGEYALVAAPALAREGHRRRDRGRRARRRAAAGGRRGPGRAELAELANVIGAPVEFIGRLDRASMARELAGAAMLLMPSRYHEFAGYSALEAMARRRAGDRVRAWAACPRCSAPSAAWRRTTPHALAGADAQLWASPSCAARRATSSSRGRARGHSEERYVSCFWSSYRRARQ